MRNPQGISQKYDGFVTAGSLTVMTLRLGGAWSQLFSAKLPLEKDKEVASVGTSERSAGVTAAAPTWTSENRVLQVFT
jgi:hypothetical protein